MRILEWVLAVILALAVGFAAIARFFSSDLRNDMADSLSLPVWFLIVVSVIEIVLAIELLIPRFRILGGIGMALTMVGATIFNIFGEQVRDANPRQGIPLTIFLAIIGFVVAWLAAGRPRSIGSLLQTAQQQLKGQVGDIAETATELT